ncbi:MAG: TolC family protein [Deltaproteobacteria bacterium]|nr:TolC family protein [Deltaproteobacteria bacterium]
MTADQSARLAVARSPAAASAQAALNKSREGAAKAWLAVYPRLELSARYTRLSEVEQGSLLRGATADLIPEEMREGMRFPQFLNQYVFRASVTYPLSDLFFTILPAYRASEGFSEAQAFSVKAEQHKIALQAREAFYNYALARASLAVARAALAQAEAHRSDVAALVAAGTVASVELMRMDAQVAAARVLVARSQGGLAIAKTGLGVLIGQRLKGDIAIAEPLYSPLPPLTKSPEEMLKQASQQRPEILALHKIIEAHSESIDASSATRYPHLALSAGVDYANPNQRVFPQEEKFKPSWDISAVLTWSPNDLFEGGHRVAESEADLTKTQSDLASLEEALVIELTQACEQYDSARAAMEAAQTGIESAEESYRVRREQFRAGAAVATEVIDAESELRDARMQLIGAAIDMRIAKAHLDRALGRP